MLTRTRWLLLSLILLAFFLRVFRLDAQSIWYDEGLSLQLAAQDPAQTIALSAVTDHPPLHALLLGGWMRFAGQSDFTVRYLSVFCGVLAVVLTYTLGKMYDERAGIIAAGLMTIAPLAVYYSQETRGYMLLTALVLVASIAALRLLGGDRRKRLWVAYVAAMALALYTHYFAAFAWAAINVAFVTVNLAGFLRHPASNDTAQKPAKSFLNWIIAQFIILFCFLPWVPNAFAQAGSNATYFPGRVTWQTVIGDTWYAFSVGEGGDASLMGWLWLALVALGVVGGLALRRTTDDLEKKSVVICSITLVVVPLILMAALAWLKPKFAPRYLLPSLPAFITLAAIGIVTLMDGTKSRYGRWAWIGLAISLALPLASFGSLIRLYVDPALARPDVRSVAQYIEAHEQSSDAILLIGGHQAPAFNHYYRGQAEVIPLPPDLLPAAQAPLDVRALSQLKDIAQQHARLWLVLWQNQISDPTNVIADTLFETAQRLSVGQNFHGLGVLLIDVRDAKINDAPQYRLNDEFSEPIRAVGYNVDSRRIPIDTPLRFGIYLEAAGPITGNYQIFTHLVGPDGSLIRQADHIAGADSYPTSLWRPANVLYNRFEMQVPAGTPPGEYRVIAGLYDERGRLKLTNGSDHIDLFDVTLTP